MAFLRSRSSWAGSTLVLGLALAVAAGGCQAILGIDETTLVPDAGTANDASSDANDGSSNDASVSLAIAPTSGKVVRGSTLDVSITLSSAAPSDVVVSAGNLPSGVTASALTFSTGATTGTLHLAAASNAALGPVSITIGSSSTNDAPLKLLVADPPGTLDSTFDGDGIKLFGDVDGGYGNTAVAVDLQSDGHIIVGGNPSQNAGWQVTRLAADGTTDTAFTASSFPVLPASGFLSDLAVGPDDKITIVGNGGSAGITVVRLNADGTPDNEFHVTGSVTVSDSAYCQYDCAGNGVTVLPDNTAIVAGEANADTTVNALVLHFLNDGSLDPNFVAPGIGWYIGPTQSRLSKVTIDPAGRIVAGGTCNSTTPQQLCALRLSAAGVPDTSFGSDAGIVEIPTSLSEFDFDIAAQGDAGYVLAGTDRTFVNADALGFIHVDGSDAGPSAIAQPIGNSDELLGVATQDDGKILAVGLGARTFANLSYLFRLNTISEPDLTFNGSGVVQFFTDGGPADPPAIYFRRVKATHDGRILVVGEKQGTGTAVMRFWQ